LGTTQSNTSVMLMFFVHPFFHASSAIHSAKQVQLLLSMYQRHRCVKYSSQHSHRLLKLPKIANVILVSSVTGHIFQRWGNRSIGGVGCAIYSSNDVTASARDKSSFFPLFPTHSPPGIEYFNRMPIPTRPHDERIPVRCNPQASQMHKEP